MLLCEPFHSQIDLLGNHSGGYSVVFQVLFNTLYKVVLTWKSVKETVMCIITISTKIIEKQCYAIVSLFGIFLYVFLYSYSFLLQ